MELLALNVDDYGGGGRSEVASRKVLTDLYTDKLFILICQINRWQKSKSTWERTFPWRLTSLEEPGPSPPSAPPVENMIG